MYLTPETPSQQWKNYVEDLDNRIDAFKNYEKTEEKALVDYKKHLVQIRDYSKKLEAPISAKICEVGYFCDAHVVRTNQVMLAITEELFIECSLFTAEKIIANRVENMEQNFKNIKETIRMYEDKKKHAEEYLSTMNDEIVEVYDEQKEREFYEQRRQRAKNNRKAATTEQKSTEKGADVEHEKMMDRLAELEKLELDADESPIAASVEEKKAPEPFEVPFEEYEEEDAESIKERLLAQPGVSRKEMEALLEYLDDCDEQSTEDEAEKVVELDSDDYDDEPSDPSKKQGVRFSKVLEKVKTFRESDVIEVVSPSDEKPVETKSILRSKEPTPVDESALEEPEPKELAAMSTVTFPGEVVEKNPYECQPSTSKDPAPVITESKVSKFRASRSRN